MKRFGQWGSGQQPSNAQAYAPAPTLFYPALFFVLACVIMLSLQVWTEWHARASHVQQTGTSLINLASSLARDAEDTFDITNTAVASVVAQLEADGPSPEVLTSLNHKLAAQVAVTARFDDIVVLGPNGNWIATALIKVGTSADRAYFRHYRDDPALGAFIGPPVQNRLNGRWIITVSRRFRSVTGGFGGVVLVTIELAHFVNQYATYDLGPGSSIVLSAIDGTLLVRYPVKEQAIGQNFSNEAVFSKLRESPMGSFWNDGKRRFVGYRQSERYPVVVLATMAEDQALGAWRTDMRTHLLIATVLAGVIGLLGLYLIRLLARSQATDERMRDSEARYRFLAENAGDMLVVLDLQFIRRYVSPGSQRLTGYTPEELLARSPDSMFHPDDTARIRATFDEVVANPTSTKKSSYRLRHRDGHWIWVEARVAVLRSPNNNVPHEIFATLRDITQRMAAESALRESEERYRLLLQSGGVTEAIYMLDAAGNVESWNAGAERIKGYTPEEIIGRNFSTFFTPEDVASGEPARALASARDHGQFTTEAWRVRKDGSRLLARITLEAIRREDGTLRGFAKVTHDITNQRIEEEQRQIIVEAAPNGMIIVNEVGVITLANSQVERIFDYPPNVLVGQPIESLVPTLFQSVSGHLQQIFPSDTNGLTIAAGQEYTGYKRDGSMIVIEIMLSPIKTPRGRIIIAALFDITDRRRRLIEQQEAERAAYQRKLETTNADLDRLSRHLAAARDRAEQANQAKSRFLAGITHELRTPLHGILGYAELLMLEDNLTPRQLQRLEVMMSSGHHLLGMINAVLDMSQIEAEQLELHPEEVYLPNFIRTCLDVVRPAADAKGLALSVKNSTPYRLVADSTRLRQVLINLLGNAIKFTPTGSIEVRQTVIEAGIRLEVADTGPGIRAQHHDKLFQTFERLNTKAMSGIEGTGLGLAIAARLVRLMDGRMGYADNPGGGSVFWLELPGQNIVRSEKIEAAFSLPATGRPQLRVLVADDEALNRSIASGFLNNAGHEVVCVDNGAAAVEAAACATFDVILMDVRMPGMNGLEATRQIRGLPPPHGEVCVIAVTAQAFAQQIEMCRQAGMDSHISKPFTQTTLLAALEKIGTAPNAPALTVMRPIPLTAAVEREHPVFDRAIFKDITDCLTSAEVTSHLQTLLARCAVLLDGLRGPEMLIQARKLVEDAHKLAGSSGMFGFLILASAASQFEEAADTNAPETGAFADQLEVAIEACMAIIQQELSTTIVET